MRHVRHVSNTRQAGRQPGRQAARQPASQMGHISSEQCGASLRLLHIGRVELTRVLEMGHLNVKNT